MMNMYFRLPKNKGNIIWTRHAVQKMRQYQLSEGQLRRLLIRYERKEEGIAPGTIALMQSAGSKKHPTEIWLMYQPVKTKIKIITAWRYPGRSPKKELIIPNDVLEDLQFDKR